MTRVKLEAFKFMPYKCKIRGCSRRAVAVKFVRKGKRMHCIRHQLAKASGRVSENTYSRDSHRFHLQGVCNLTGKTWGQQKDELMPLFRSYGLSKREIIKQTTRLFEIDHIDGNHKNNSKKNLQTVTKAAHMIKSLSSGDFSSFIRSKRKLAA